MVAILPRTIMFQFSIQILLKFAPNGPVNNKQQLV